MRSSLFINLSFRSDLCTFIKEKIEQAIDLQYCKSYLDQGLWCPPVFTLVKTCNNSQLKYSNKITIISLINHTPWFSQVGNAKNLEYFFSAHAMGKICESEHVLKECTAQIWTERAIPYFWYLWEYYSKFLG